MLKLRNATQPARLAPERFAAGPVPTSSNIFY